MSINGNQADYYNNNNTQFNSTSYPATHSRKKSINNQQNNTNVATVGNITNLNNNGQFNSSQISSGNHTANSGGRKPTADSHAYTLYKPNKPNARGKFSNGGGSITGQEQEYENEANLNNSGFSSNANATASRFYNPSKQSTPHNNNVMNETQSRFMQNL